MVERCVAFLILYPDITNSLLFWKLSGVALDGDVRSVSFTFTSISY